MKTLIIAHNKEAHLKTLMITLMTFLMVFSLTSVQAQRISATFNANSFQKNSGNVDFDRSMNLALNLRYYTNSKIGIRAGVGVENLRYSVGADQGIVTDLESKRQDLKGTFGIEYHPTLGKWLDIYPGLYIPVTVVGDDLINNNLSNLSGGNFSAGLGGVLGANVRFLKIFRIGVEFDAKYEAFKGATLNAVDEFSLKPYGRMNYGTSFTLGIMI